MNNLLMNNIFIIAGMPRGGTTFLYYTFLKHPAVFLPYHKETNFFSVNYDKGLDWYKQLYRDMREGQIGADINPSYFVHPYSIERIKNFNSDVKVVLTVRKPSDWALSTYSQYLNYTWQAPPFEKFVEGYELQLQGEEKFSLVFKEGLIAGTIAQYREAFGDNILLCDFNLLQKDPLRMLLAIERFIELTPHFTKDNVENIAINAGNRKNPKIISYLVSRKPVKALLSIMPRRTVHFFHNFFLKWGQKKSEQNAKVYTPKNIQLAKQIFSKDDIYVQELLSKGQIQLGDGSRFESPS